MVLEDKSWLMSLLPQSLRNMPCPTISLWSRDDVEEQTMKQTAILVSCARHKLRPWGAPTSLAHCGPQFLLGIKTLESVCGSVPPTSSQSLLWALGSKLPTLPSDPGKSHGPTRLRAFAPARTSFVLTHPVSSSGCYLDLTSSESLPQLQTTSGT